MSKVGAYVRDDSSGVFVNGKFSEFRERDHAALAEIADHAGDHAADEFVAGLLWRWLFNTDIPSYLSGVVGGVTVVPIWELMKRIESVTVCIVTACQMRASRKGWQ